MVLMYLLPTISFIALVLVILNLIKKDKTKFIRAFIVLGLSLIGLLFLESTEYWKVDSCLDSGGRYDYEQGKCEH